MDIAEEAGLVGCHDLGHFFVKRVGIARAKTGDDRGNGIDLLGPDERGEPGLDKIFLAVFQHDACVLANQLADKIEIARSKWHNFQTSTPVTQPAPAALWPEAKTISHLLRNEPSRRR